MVEVNHTYAIAKEDLSVSSRCKRQRSRPEGNLHWYAFEAGGLARLAKSLLSEDEVARWADEVTEEVPNHLIQNYLEPDGRLRQIPATRKKRRTVLAWLATHFDYDRRYREAEVNQILQTRNWDSATLRQELVGYRMLERERGIYWRLPEGRWLQIHTSRAPALK